MIDKIMIYIKGILMGICDIIPGISGGTIAFITGIYSRLINAVKAFSPSVIKDFFSYIIKRDKASKRRISRDIRNMDLLFLIPLILGISTAFLVMSKVISYLLEKHFEETIFFFIGLIIVSAMVIFKKIRDHKAINIIFGIIGVIIGAVTSFISPLSVEPSLFYIFIGGFLAISAMFLPGISGAFILLLLGIYDFMLGILHDLANNLNYFFVFMCGAIAGAFSISRIISFLFKKDRYKTLYILLGLVIGSLILPLRRVLDKTNNYITSIMIFFLLVGMLIAYLISKLEKHKVIEVDK